MNQTAAMKVLGQYKTVSEAIQEAVKQGLDEETAIIESVDGDDQRSVREWRKVSD